MRRVLERLNNICLFIFSSCRLDGLIDAAVSRQNVEHVGIFPLLDLFWQPSEFLWCEPLLLSSAFCRPLSHVFVIVDVFLPPGARPVLDVSSLLFFVSFWLIDVTRVRWSVKLLGQRIRLKRSEVTEAFIVVVCGVKEFSGSLASLVYDIFLLTLREATRWEELSAEMGRWMWFNLSVLTKEKHLSVEVGLELHFILSASVSFLLSLVYEYDCSALNHKFFFLLSWNEYVDTASDNSASCIHLSQCLNSHTLYGSSVWHPRIKSTFQ